MISFDQQRISANIHEGMERQKTRSSLFSATDDDHGDDYDGDRPNKTHFNVLKQIGEDEEETETNGAEGKRGEVPPVDDIDKIPWSVRKYYDMIVVHGGKIQLLHKIIQIVTYVLYIAFVTIATVRQIKDIPPAVEWAVFAAWTIMIASHDTIFVVLGRRQHFAWHGYPLLFQHGSALVIIALLIFTGIGIETNIHKNITRTAEYIALVLMGIYMFIREILVSRTHDELALFYVGAVSLESLIERWEEWKAGKQEEACSDEELIKSFELSRKVLGIAEEVPIRKALEGQHLRAEPVGRGYDWALTVQKLLKHVSFAPGFCRSKTKMSSLQCRNLIRQVLVFDEMYRKTGKINFCALSKRTLPLSTTETMSAMLRLSFSVPWAFLHAVIPGVLFGSVTIILPTVVFAGFQGAVAGKSSCVCFSSPDLPECKLVVDSFQTQDQCEQYFHQEATMFFWIMVIGTSVVVPIIVMWMSFAWSSYVAKLGDHCRRKMFARLVRGGTEYGEIHQDGKLVNAFSNELSKLEGFAFSGFLPAIPSITAFIGAVVLSILYYPFAAVIFISLVPVVLSLRSLDNAQTKAAFDNVNADAAFGGKIVNIVECRSAIRTCNAGNWVESTSQELLKQTKLAHLKNYSITLLVSNLFMASTSLFGLFILIPLGLQVINGSMDFAQFIVIYGALSGIQATIQMVGNLKGQLGLYSGTLQTIEELMDNSSDEENSSSTADKSTSFSPLSQQMKVDKLVFRYDGMETNVLEKINLNFGKGTYVVLTGGSGSGKSTILNILYRFRKPNDGSVEWDGTNLFGVPLESFREQVAVMFQKTMIYEGTVRDNILFGMKERPGGVEEAAEMAEIAETIRALPDGYDTVIGGGSPGGLSGGQMQRICLARALYRQPSVLLLDEATSSLDAVAADAIIETLVRLRDEKGYTIVSVSHHPSTAIKANQIVVLKKGVIAEEGTYNELVARENGIFRQLVEISEKEKSD